MFGGDFSFPGMLRRPPGTGRGGPPPKVDNSLAGTRTTCGATACATSPSRDLMIRYAEEPLFVPPRTEASPRSCSCRTRSASLGAALPTLATRGTSTPAPNPGDPGGQLPQRRLHRPGPAGHGELQPTYEAS
ncbi:hypothetical protein ACRAWD_28545 [Caulobacter segnis]